MNSLIQDSELILNSDGSIYHLQLKPDEVAETIITVGDPERVAHVSKHFDSIQHKVQHREFITHTGYLNNKRLTVLSTGMGTDNIDIALTELDALVNIDFTKRIPKQNLTSLNIIRLGTSGSVNAEVDIDTILISEFAIGLDGLLNYYKVENSIEEIMYLEAFSNYLKQYFNSVKPYITSASNSLLKKFETKYPKGTTLTACGFFAPQGRKVRLESEFPDFIKVIQNFHYQNFRISNLEMETAGIYGLGKLLGHNCLSVNAIIANRINQTFSINPQMIVDKMIGEALEIITTN